MSKLAISIAALCLFPMLVSCTLAQEKGFNLAHSENKVTVNLDGKLFTEYDFASYKKPILYPLITDGGQGITRNAPMKKVEGEANDHPHHKSVWFAHGDINGLDFWSEKAEIKTSFVRFLDEDSQRIGFVSASRWMNGDEVLFESETTVSFRADGTTRFVEFEFDLTATKCDLVFGDTKEGTFAVRTHPNLRLVNDEKQGVVSANGHAVNSEGIEGKSVWGMNAKWIDYSGKIDGELFGIAICDHPDNLRHPTTWHAREYGLVAANPFGLHHFQRKPRGTGNHTVLKGESLKLRYLLVVHRGNAETANIDELYSDWSSGRSDKK